MKIVSIMLWFKKSITYPNLEDDYLSVFIEYIRIYLEIDETEKHLLMKVNSRVPSSSN